MASVDHNSVKQRIVDILAAKTELKNGTSEFGKIRLFAVGHPSGKDIDDNQRPSIYVTLGRPFELISDIGILKSNSIQRFDHVVRYNIVIVAHESKSRNTERALDYYQQHVIDAIQENNDLRKPVTPNDDPKSDNTIPERVEPLNPGQYSGTEVQGRVITFKTMIAT